MTYSTEKTILFLYTFGFVTFLCGLSAWCRNFFFILSKWWRPECISTLDGLHPVFTSRQVCSLIFHVFKATHRLTLDFPSHYLPVPHLFMQIYNIFDIFPSCLSSVLYQVSAVSIVQVLLTRFYLKDLRNLLWKAAFQKLNEIGLKCSVMDEQDGGTTNSRLRKDRFLKWRKCYIFVCKLSVITCSVITTSVYVHTCLPGAHVLVLLLYLMPCLFF